MQDNDSSEGDKVDSLDLSLLPETARVDDSGRLSIGGVDLLDLASDVGTPAFVYDVQDLRTRFREAREVFGEGAAYATKAFLCKAVARLAHEAGLSLDVATEGEYYTCRKAGVPASSLVLHGNNKTERYIETGIAEGAQWIVVDGFGDLALIAAVAERLERPAKVLLRINPGVEVHTHRFNRTGNRRSKFGIPMWNGDAEQALHIARESRWIELVGLHMHVGSLVFSTDTFVSAVESIADFVKMADLPVLVVGGGLGVRYLNWDTAPTLREWADAIFGYCAQRDIRQNILAEPGRSLVAPAAITLYTVGRLEVKGDDRYVAVDGGMSDNPRPLLYDSGYELFLVRDVLAERDLRVTMVGSHCESGDTIVRDGGLPSNTRLGDVIATPVTGGYGYSMSSNYNRMPRPPIVFVENGKYEVVVRRETIDDLLNTDLE